MPRGVFVRTAQYREKISKTLIGHPCWNGFHISDTTITVVNEVRSIIAASPAKLTIKQIHEALAVKGILIAGHKGYVRFHYYISEALKSGRLDGSKIYNGKGFGMYRGKFKVGDRVRIARENKGTPKWLREELRLDTPRTIVAVVPVRKENSRNTRYFVGSNGIGPNFLELHSFRSQELEFYSKKTTAGRPSTKRKYTRHHEDTSPANSALLINPSESPSISCVNQNNNELVGVC